MRTKKNIVLVTYTDYKKDKIKRITHFKSIQELCEVKNIGIVYYYKFIAGEFREYTRENAMIRFSKTHDIIPITACITFALREEIRDYILDNELDNYPKERLCNQDSDSESIASFRKLVGYKKKKKNKTISNTPSN